MFRRLFWFALGAYVGYRAAERVRQLAEQPVVDKLRLVSREVRDVVRDLTGDPAERRAAG